MKGPLSLAVVALILVVAAAGHAQAPVPLADKPPQSKPIRNVSGTVRSAAPDTIVVGARDRGKDALWTFVVEQATIIRKGGKSVTASDLKPGDAVQVRYVERDGKPTAESILVSGSRTNVPEAEPK